MGGEQKKMGRKGRCLYWNEKKHSGYPDQLRPRCGFLFQHSQSRSGGRHAQGIFVRQEPGSREANSLKLVSGTKSSSIRLKHRNSDNLRRHPPMKSPLLLKITVTITALSLLLSACGPSPSASLAKSDLQRVTSPDTPPNDIQALVDSNNTLAFDLYQSLKADAQGGNLFYSPYSISLALAMVYAGAGGETES